MQKDAESADTTADAPVEKKEPAKKEEPKKEEKKKAEKKDKKDKNDKKKAHDKKDKKDDKKPAKKDKKKEEEQEIPMDQAAIKAYSSVIADAAEDSSNQTPVQYHQVITEEDKPAQKTEPF
jgi:hypothetical protein